MGLRVFVINLDRSRGRWAASQAAFAQAGLVATRVPAACGRSVGGLDHPSYARAERLETYGADLGPGAIGCYLSHLQAMRTAIDLGCQRFAILEDDVVPAPGFAETLEAIAALPKSFGFVRLYGIKRRPARDLGPLTATANLKLLLQGPGGTQGYVITRAAAEKFLARCSTIRMQIDIQLDRYWEWGERAFLIDPAPIEDAPALSVVSDNGARAAELGLVAEASRTAAQKRALLLRKWRDDALRIGAGLWALSAEARLKAEARQALSQGLHSSAARSEPAPLQAQSGTR